MEKHCHIQRLVYRNVYHRLSVVTPMYVFLSVSFRAHCLKNREIRHHCTNKIHKTNPTVQNNWAIYYTSIFFEELLHIFQDVKHKSNLEHWLATEEWIKVTNKKPKFFFMFNTANKRNSQTHSLFKSKFTSKVQGL